MQPESLAPSPRWRLRFWIVAAVEIAGIALIALGAAMIFLPAGVIAAGIGLVLFALAAQMGGGDAR